MRGEPRGQLMATATAHVTADRVQTGVEWRSWRCSSPTKVATLACAVHVTPEVPLTSTQVGRAPPGGVQHGGPGRWWSDWGYILKTGQTRLTDGMECGRKRNQHDFKDGVKRSAS